MKKLLLIILLPLTAQAETDLECLAKNIYHESRGEPLKGQLAVAQVTINRRMPWQTICQVVYKPNQFSWTTNPPPILDFNSWINSVLLANTILRRGWAINKFWATHYHNHRVQPNWADPQRYLTTIGQHHFYEL